MIIADKDGLQYVLLRTKLAVHTRQMGERASPMWHIRLNDLRVHSGRSVQLWNHKYGPGYYIRVPVTNTSIGCKRFTKTDMAKIFKVAGVKRARKSTR